MATRGSSDLPESAEIHPVGQVSADTHADNLRHAHLRAHFMNALLTDPRMTAWGAIQRSSAAPARAASHLRKLRGSLLLVAVGKVFESLAIETPCDLRLHTFRLGSSG